MTDDPLTEIRSWIREVEGDLDETRRRVDVHEQKCANRYQIIIIALFVILVLTLPTGLPHIIEFLSLLH